MPAEPETQEEVGWLDSAENSINAAIEAGKVVLDSTVEEWRTTGALSDPKEFESEDAEDAQKLVRYSEAVAATFALRDDILNRELPPILEGIFDTINRAWESMKAGVKGWWELLAYGRADTLMQAARQMALNTSPRGFIGRVNEARQAAEQRLRKKALFAKSEVRWQRKISSRA